MFLYFCGDMCCKWAEVDGTCGCKCEMWPTVWQGAVRRVQGKVGCSPVVSVVLWGLWAVPFLHEEQYFTLLALE
jgi:hypothetical protein